MAELDDELENLLNQEFKFEDEDERPVAISGGTDAVDICKDNFDFPLKDSDIPNQTFSQQFPLNP